VSARTFDVGVWPLPYGKRKFRAYLRIFFPDDTDCCVHKVRAASARKARRVAIQEHEDRCVTEESG